MPRNPDDLHSLVEALGPLLPAASRAAISPESDRVSLPAPDGPAMLTAALSRLNAANIELADIVLRRPSLDDVFLSLTGDAAGGRSTERVAGAVPSLVMSAPAPLR